jgi:hypothetical protein
MRRFRTFSWQTIGPTPPAGQGGWDITTATLRDATGRDQLVRELAHEGLVRHGLRRTADVDGGRRRRPAHPAADRRARGPSHESKRGRTRVNRSGPDRSG